MGEPSSNLKPGKGRRPSLPPDDERAMRLTSVFDAQGWSWRDLAEEVGADETTVKRWVTTGAISAEGIGKLSRALLRSRDYIVTGDESQTMRGAPGEADVAARLDHLERILRGETGKLATMIAQMEQRQERPQLSGQRPTHKGEVTESQ